MTRLPLALAALLLMQVGPLLAQGPRQVPDITDCARPATTAAQHFCGSPTLREAEAEVFRLSRLAVEAGPMCWSVRSEHELWKMAARNPTSRSADLHATYAEQGQRLHAIAQETTALLDRRVSRDDLAARCVTLPNLSFVTFVRPCRIVEVVGVAPGIIAQRQVWNGAGGPNVLDTHLRFSSAVLLLEYGGTDPDGGSSGSDAGWVPIGWADEAEGELETPIYSEGRHGAFITVPRTFGGMGAISMDVVLRRIDRFRWRELDASTWRTEILRRISRPLSPLGHAPLDLANLSADLDLLRPDDPRCCPTGGRAEVRLTLGEDVLVVDGVTFRPGRSGPPSGPPRR